MKLSLLDGGRFALGVTIGFLIAVLFALLLGELDYEFWDNDTLLGALIGGGLAGFFAIAATAMANFQQAKVTEAAKRQELETIAFAVFSRLNDLFDSITKSYRHHLDGDDTLRIHYGDQKSLPKPLLAREAELGFTVEDKNLGLHLKNAELFNLITDADGIARNFLFLRAEYERRFFEFQTNVYRQNDLSVSGSKVVAAAEINPVELLELESIAGHFLSFLMRAQKEVRSMHTEVIVVLEGEFSRKVDFVLTSQKSQATNFFD
ncbi:hypothetical protein [uncultured Tateyamaria sp.]|uniref:hypothetical protein n=1 Tax=uncultured Tateyamaria sp. TaxID=455651 RepID=UPI00262F2A6B|nr:hypothetical protein [uncultured Tateyamaria sp.]